MRRRRPASFGLGGTYAEGAVDRRTSSPEPGRCPARCNSDVTTGPAAQTIDVPAIGPVTYGVAPFALTATASSGLPVTFALAPGGPCALSGATLTINGAGYCDITATQPGDNVDWAAAPPVTQRLSIAKQPTVTTVGTTPPSGAITPTTPVTIAAGISAQIVPFFGIQPPTGTVNFFIDGSSKPVASAPVFVASDGSWRAEIHWTFGAGRHSIAAMYGGDQNFGSSDNIATPKVFELQCDRTITGKHGSVTVTAGLTCIDHATISGGISVAKGASLDVEKSTVNGSISANAPAGVRICGSHTGAVSVSASSAPVLIGDPPSCAHNTISAGVTAANNRAGVTIVGNTIGGGVTAAGNTGGQVISGNHH